MSAVKEKEGSKVSLKAFVRDVQAGDSSRKYIRRIYDS